MKLNKEKAWVIGQTFVLLSALILIVCIVKCLIDIGNPKAKQETDIVNKANELVCEIPIRIVEMAKKEDIDDKWYIREDIPMTKEDQRLLMKACLKTDCPYDLALAVCWVETGMVNKVGDSGESLGYMQIQPKWVGNRMKAFGVTDLMDAYSNFLVGTNILSEYVNKFGTVDGLTKYNSGHLGKSNYAEKVLEYREKLQSEEANQD